LSATFLLSFVDLAVFLKDQGVDGLELLFVVLFGLGFKTLHEPSGNLMVTNISIVNI
jgi:hypothetical protein